MNAVYASRRDVTERDWAAQVAQLAKLTGWRRYHTLRSKGSASGWPDEALVRDRLVVAELKREGGKPMPTQVEWLDALAAAGAEVYLWLPSDLQEIGEILSRRWRFVPAGDDDGPRLVDGGVSFAPRSAWLPGRGRRDA